MLDRALSASMWACMGTQDTKIEPAPALDIIFSMFMPRQDQRARCGCRTEHACAVPMLTLHMPTLCFSCSWIPLQMGQYLWKARTTLPSLVLTTPWGLSFSPAPMLTGVQDSKAEVPMHCYHKDRRALLEVSQLLCITCVCDALAVAGIAWLPSAEDDKAHKIMTSRYHCWPFELKYKARVDPVRQVLVSGFR